MDGLVGHKIGPYELRSLLGSGGMGAVYEGIHEILEQERAVKVMSAHLASHSGFVSLFRREAMLAAKLRHRNVVQIHDVGEENGRNFIVMERLTGRTLRDVVKAESPLGVERVIHILEQLADALDYAHSQRVSHRDVKPANIFVDSSDHVTLVDFGIARAADGTHLTITTGIGTPEYMAPEAFDDEILGPDADPYELGVGTDLYAIGVVAYELIAGRVPFTGRTPQSVAYNQVHRPPPPIRSLRAGLPDAIEPVLVRQLSKHPADRYPTACDFVANLREAVRQMPSDVFDAHTIPFLGFPTGSSTPTPPPYNAPRPATPTPGGPSTPTPHPTPPPSSTRYTPTPSQPSSHPSNPAAFAPTPAPSPNTPTPRAPTGAGPHTPTVPPPPIRPGTGDRATRGNSPVSAPAQPSASGRVTPTPAPRVTDQRAQRMQEPTVAGFAPATGATEAAGVGRRNETQFLDTSRRSSGRLGPAALAGAVLVVLLVVGGYFLAPRFSPATTPDAPATPPAVAQATPTAPAALPATPTITAANAAASAALNQPTPAPATATSAPPSATPVPPTPTLTVAQKVQEVEAVLGSGDTGRAVEMAQALKAADPGGPGVDDLLVKAFLAHGKTLLDRQDIDGSYAMFGKVLELRPDSAAARDGQSQAILLKDWRALEANWGKDDEAALAAATEIMRIDPNSRDIRDKLYALQIAKGDRLLKAGDRDGAYTVLMAALETRPDGSEALDLLKTYTPTPTPRPIPPTPVPQPVATRAPVYVQPTPAPVYVQPTPVPVAPTPVPQPAAPPPGGTPIRR